MYRNAKLKTEGIPDLIARYKGDLKFQMGEEPTFYMVSRKKNSSTEEMMGLAEALLKELRALAFS